MTYNGLDLKQMLQAGTAWLELHVGQVNRLNVFPVPDGDTGTNMLLTMKAALKEIEQIADHRVDAIAAAAAQGALMGARGNSGVILSQLLAGVAAGLKDKIIFTAAELAGAIQLGVEQAYQTVIEPVEGTILTVSRAAADAAGRTSQAGGSLIALFAAMVEAARAAQLRTPELLPALKEAGVTDSGGQGLLYILEGAWRWLRHEPLELNPAAEVPMPSIRYTGDQPYGYDVQFLLYGQQLDLAVIQAQLEMMGHSVLVVGEQELAKIHIHAADPAVVLNYGASLGLAADLLVEDMSAQVEAFLNPELVFPGASARPAVEIAKDVEIVAFAPGKGFVDIFQSLGVDQVILSHPGLGVLQAGAKAQPFLSPQIWLNLIRRVAANRIIVLPNRPELIPLIEQIGAQAQKEIAVIPARSAPQGIAAALAFQRQLDFETNLARMGQASLPVRTIELKPPQVNSHKWAPDELLGFQEDRLITVGVDEHKVALELLAKVEGGAAEIITIYFGQNSSQSRADLLADRINQHYSDLTVEVYDGGQPHSFYLISLE